MEQGGNWTKKQQKLGKQIGINDRYVRNAPDCYAFRMARFAGKSLLVLSARTWAICAGYEIENRELLETANRRSYQRTNQGPSL